MEASCSFRLVTIWLLTTLLGGTSDALANRAAQLGCAECDRVVARVLRLLPRRPVRVVVIDAETAPPALRHRIEHTEGFVTAGDSAVYLKRQGSTFQLALRGPGACDYALAIIIWHEMVHVNGGDERTAQHQEEWLWQQFMLERRVNWEQGLRYLALLRKRDR
jgi:hypothetical protein